MANVTVAQFAVFSMSAALFIYALVVMRKRKTQSAPLTTPQVRPAVEKSKSMQLKPVQSTAGPREPTDADRPMPRTVKVETASTYAPPSSVVNLPSTPAVAKPTVVIDVQAALTTQGDRREQILAGISENIRKGLQTRQVVQHTTLTYAESKPRNTEYVRVKKEIITPHGQIRFSILKDWMATNMLAVFRRASMDWKTPEDLIAFLPEYLEPEAEILNGQILLIGTPGHLEKLAVPIRNLDTASGLRECFNFVTDVRTTANTPAILLTSDDHFEVVSKGVITQTLFMNAVEPGHWDVKFLAVMGQIESTVGADAH